MTSPSYAGAMPGGRRAASSACGVSCVRCVRNVRRAPICCAAATASGIERCSGCGRGSRAFNTRSEEHTSELQSQSNLVCRLLLEKKKRTEADDPEVFFRSVRKSWQHR